MSSSQITMLPAEPQTASTKPHNKTTFIHQAPAPLLGLVRNDARTVKAVEGTHHSLLTPQPRRLLTNAANENCVVVFHFGLLQKEIEINQHFAFIFKWPLLLSLLFTASLVPAEIISVSSRLQHKRRWLSQLEQL